jgi:predicted ATP-grasp superfamily ATP-dependent carboligase
MIRCYGEHGIKPIVILYGSNDSFLLCSKHIEESFVVGNEKDALDLLSKNKVKWEGSLVISCTDAIASLLDINFDALKDTYHVFNCKQAGLLTHYMNKLVQTGCAKEVGFDIPESIEGLVGDISNCRIPYPRIIKPVESIHGGKHIAICRNESAFVRNLNTFAKEDKVIVQHFIQKEYEIVVVGLAVDKEIIIPGYVHKHREEKGGTTYSTIEPPSFLPSFIMDKCKRLVERFEYQGLFGIELIKQGEQYYFIEMNLRNDATTYSLAVAGINLPVMLLQHVSGQNEITSGVGNIREIHSMVEFSDFIHVLKREVGLNTWWRQLKHCECRYLYSKEDSLPYYKCRKQFVQFLLRRLTRIKQFINASR